LLFDQLNATADVGNAFDKFLTLESGQNAVNTRWGSHLKLLANLSDGGRLIVNLLVTGDELINLPLACGYGHPKTLQTKNPCLI
jgi:hypothetical protein